MADHVLITGGAHRLGQLLVRSFAQAGWHVWCHYARSGEAAHALQEELRGEGWAVDTVAADLAHESEALAMMAHLAQRSGGLRAVVNNASVFEPDTGIDFDPALTRRQLEVNLIAPLLLGRELARQQAARQASTPSPDACVVHLLDQKVFNLNPDYFSYTTSKLALERSVALQAQALAPAVRVCGVAPGLIYPSGPQTDDNFARASRVNLLRRATDPQDVANTCRFLAENRGVNGVTLAVDNGQHLVPLERDVMFAVSTLKAQADHG